MIAGGVQTAAVVLVGAALGSLAGGRIGAVLGGAVSLVPALLYWRLIAGCRPYARSGSGVALCLLDATWSALNTWAGAWFHAVLVLRRNVVEAERSTGTGRVFVAHQAIPGYATTIGIVQAGCSPRLEPHERVHVVQARLFGPMYLPLVGLGFVVATLLPYWLLSSAARTRVRDARSYFERGVYPNTWHEWWAYRAAPSSSH